MISLMYAAAIAVGHAGLPPVAPSWQVTPVGDAATEIAHVLNARETLRSMILMALTDSDEGVAMAARLGETRADALLSAAADTIAWRHAAQWEENLAAAYRETLSANELATVLGALRRNDRSALEPFSTRVGLALFRKSSPLIQQASSETMAAVRARAVQ